LSNFLPKVKNRGGVRDAVVERAVEAIINPARTGRNRRRKIFVSSVEDVIRIPHRRTWRGRRLARTKNHSDTAFGPWRKTIEGPPDEGVHGAAPYSLRRLPSGSPARHSRAKGGEVIHGLEACGRRQRRGKVMEMLTEHSVEYVDLRFTDPRGKWSNNAQHVSTIEETRSVTVSCSRLLDRRLEAINESDMILMPDPDTAVMDPFSAKASLILFCGHRRAFDRAGVQPRSSLHGKEGRAYLKSSGVGDNRVLRPEAEFFVFDSVRFGTGGNYGTINSNSQEARRPALKGLSGRQHGPPAGGEGRLLPGAAGRQRERPAAPRCCPPWARWAW